MHVQKSMRKASGFIFETNPDTGKVQEFETCMCGHCNRHVPMWEHQSGTGYWCSHCGKSVCPQCAAKGDCDPFQAKLARAMERNRLYQDVREF